MRPNRSLIQFAALILIVFLVVSLMGCRRPAPPSNVLLMALRSDPMFLNPIIASEVTSITVNSFIFNSLLKFNEDMEIVGDLAESWKAEEKGRIWTFRLRRDVTWHDGKPFIAEDVKFTFEKLFDSTTNTYNRGLFQVDGQNPEVHALDDHTVQFILPRPFAPFISNLTALGIVPSHVLRDKDINRCEFNWHPIGTGPFRFHEWKSSERIFLVSNPSYFNGPPKLRGIVLIIIPSAESRRIALMTDTVDISALSTEDLVALKKTNNIDVFRWRQFCYYYVGFDLTRELFKDRNVRKAINYAIDKKNIVKAVLRGTGTTATGPIPLPSWAYSPDVEQYDYDPRRASDLLKEAGWERGKGNVLTKNGKTLEFELRYPSGSPPCEKASVFIQGYLMDVGIKVNLRATEFSALINFCNPGQFQSIILDWSENYDPDCFTEWHSSQMGDKGMNFMSFRNSEADKLLQAARETVDRNKRKALYRKFQKVVVDEAPYVFLWNPDYVVAVNKRVQGLPKPGPAGLFTNVEKIYLKSDRTN
jgi:peptide/nickel transport system substrate-binding protein